MDEYRKFYAFCIFWVINGCAIAYNLPVTDIKLFHKKSPCGPDSIYCHASHDYPESWKIEDAENEEFRQMFHQKPLAPRAELMAMSNATHSEKILCESKTEIIYPKEAIHMTSEIRYQIINDFGLYQGFYADICDNPGESCTFGSTPATICVQTYIYRPMVAFDFTANNKPFQGIFKVPFCCKCTFK